MLTAEQIISTEVVLICKCLIQILKCSAANRLTSFWHVSATEVLPLLIQLWEKSAEMKNESNRQSSELDDGIVSIVRLLRVFSKLTPAKSYFIGISEGAFLGKLLVNISVLINEPPTNIMWEYLGFVKDLTFRSGIDDKRTLLQSNKGILFNILLFSFGQTNGFQEQFQNWCTAVIWNLVLDPLICQLFLSKIIGNKKHVGNIIVEGLLQVLMQHSTTSKNSELSQKIKRNATSALGNIVSDSSNHPILFQDKREDQIFNLILQLLVVAREDSDPVIRRRAMRTVRCLACSMGVQSRKFVQGKTLSSSLVDILSQKEMYENQNDHDVLVQACQTVIALKESIGVESLIHIQTALVQRIEYTTDASIIPATIRCLSECISTESNCVSPCFSIKFWNNIERSVSINSKIHAAVSDLLMAIAKLEKRLDLIESRNLSNPSILTKKPVVNAITTMLSESDTSQEYARNQSLEIVSILMENESNKRPLAENDKLLSGLVALCLLQPGLKTKDSAKNIILQLVPEI